MIYIRNGAVRMMRNAVKTPPGILLCAVMMRNSNEMPSRHLFMRGFDA